MPGSPVQATGPESEKCYGLQRPVWDIKTDRGITFPQSNRDRLPLLVLVSDLFTNPAGEDMWQIKSLKFWLCVSKCLPLLRLGEHCPFFNTGYLCNTLAEVKACAL